MKPVFNIFIIAAVVALTAAPSAFATGSGITGQTIAGCTCHSGDPTPSVSITVTSASGSFNVQPGGVLNLKAVVAHTINNQFGVDIAVRASATGGAAQGTLAVAANETGLKFVGFAKELTHKTPKIGTNNEAAFEFTWTAPATPGTYFLHLAAAAANGNGQEDGDSWNKITPLAITVGSTGVEEQSVVNALILEAFPNPSQGGITLKFALETAAECEITLADLRGNPVFALPKHRREAGEQAIPWNGRDAAGNPAAAGRYIAVVRSGSKVSHIPFSIVR